MKLEKLELQNFRSYKELTLDLDNQGLTLILGGTPQLLSKANGKGKSSIYYAILYAFYGELPSGVKGNDIINNKVGKNCYVKLTFRSGKSQYRVERYRKDKTNKNKVLLFKGDKDISLPTNKATDAKIVEVINMSMKTMLNSLVFSSETMNAFTNATDKERKEILEELTNTSIYKEALQLVKDDAKLNNDLLATTNNEIRSLTEKLEYQNKSRKNYETQSYAITQKIKELKSKYDKLSETSSSDAAKLKSLLDSYTSSYKAVSEEINQYVYKDTSLLVNTVSELRNSYKQLSKSMKDAKEQIAEDKSELLQLENSPSPTCKWCGSLLTDKHKAIEQKRLMERIKQNISMYTESNKKRESCIKKGKSKQKELDELNLFNNQIKDKTTSLKAKADNINKSMTDVRNKLYNSSLNETQKESILSEINSYKNTILKATVSDDDIKLTSDKLASSNHKVVKLKAKSEKYKELQIVFGNQGVKSHVLGLMIPYINEQMTSYMQILSKGSLNAGITNYKENKDGSSSDKLDIVVESLGVKRKFNELSSGEKKRVAIALNLSFMSYLSTRVPDINVAVFDEVFDSLDKEGTDAVIELLRELSSKISTVFVISHSQELKYSDAFDKTILIDKIEGNSELISQ